MKKLINSLIVIVASAFIASVVLLPDAHAELSKKDFTRLAKIHKYCQSEGFKTGYSYDKKGFITYIGCHVDGKYVEGTFIK